MGKQQIIFGNATINIGNAAIIYLDCSNKKIGKAVINCGGCSNKI